MNSLIKTTKLRTEWLRKASPAIIAVRNHWFKDYQPGPYPLTEEERIAAAKKYGIPVQEYEAFPDNGDGLGDYPKLPPESGESRDEFYPWDYPELKRNFNEVVHDNFEAIREDRVNVNAKPLQPLWALALQFFGVVGGLYCLKLVADQAKIFHAVIPPEFPKPGKVHYTFEPAEQ